MQNKKIIEKLVLMCLTVMIVAGFLFHIHGSLAILENKTLMQPQVVQDMAATTNASRMHPNGLKLTDDIIDIQLTVLTTGRITTDKVGHHQDLSTVFPYSGSPHPIH